MGFQILLFTCPKLEEYYFYKFGFKSTMQGKLLKLLAHQLQLTLAGEFLTSRGHCDPLNNSKDEFLLPMDQEIPSGGAPRVDSTTLLVSVAVLLALRFSVRSIRDRVPF
ncbi:hypothetical protein P7K49_028112 [Saguinus oedipus]|uniref:Uncharacterized protein n=1 Tax=Saguinus oedipus TaxID=9490 RepID=A0ABQ9UC44_SAGOE|nr:hypothetical protein P7K49_028112 [Saguinus oedipus]